jgi:hypothetical protein
VVTGIEPIDDIRKVDWAKSIPAYMSRAEEPQDKTYPALLSEAVYGPSMVHACARQALKALAAVGVDLRKPGLADIAVPTYGGVGMHLLGFPERFTTGAHREQFERLLARVAKLREQLPQSDRRWFDALRRATQRFQFDGEAPDDPLMVDAILVLGELTTLLRAKAGEAVEQELAAFASAAGAAGEARTHAVRHLQALAAAGVFAHEAA